MAILSFIISVIALAIAIAAFKRTGGVHELKHQVQSLSSTTESVRDRTADALNRLEHFVRGRERPKSDPTMGGVTERTPAEDPRPGPVERSP
jgi:hypothetical protein